MDNLEPCLVMLITTYIHIIVMETKHVWTTIRAGLLSAVVVLAAIYTIPGLGSHVVGLYLIPFVVMLAVARVLYRKEQKLKELEKLK
jgi:hypothetical protein